MLSISKIGVIGRTYRHLNRYRRILVVLFKYGFGDLIELLRIDQYLEVGLQLISKTQKAQVERLSRAERIRMAFEELGPTFIKLGQILSTRPDLIPVEFIDELARLQNRVPPFAFEEVTRIASGELGAPLEEVFDAFEETPLASASIGQVHRAKLKNGEEVAVKVQRPGIRKTVQVDLEIMLHLATLMERHVEEIAFHQPVKIVQEFARTMEKELDYSIEATHMERFNHNFLDDTTIYIPRVYRQATTKRVLTTEFVEGIKISEIDALKAAGLDCQRITSLGADIYLKMIFQHGLFHADPHPGNIFVLPGNVICLFDFGMVGSVTRMTRERFVDLIEAVVNQDASRVAQVLLKITLWEEDPDLVLLEKDVADFMVRHLYKPLKDIEIAGLLRELLELSSQYRLRIPVDVFLMMKALGTIEGVARRLNPDFDMIGQAAPFIKQVKLERFKPQRVAGDLVLFAEELLHFLQQFPKDMTEISRVIREHKLNLSIEHQGMGHMLRTQDQTSNRISFAIIIAALIVGSALIIISNIPPLFHGISLIGIVGFFTAAFMGIWLLVAILRKGRL